MPGSELVVVQRFKSRQEAELAKSALEAADIEAMVLSDDAGGTQPGLWQAQGIALVVRAENESAARQVLDIPAEPIQ